MWINIGLGALAMLILVMTRYRAAVVLLLAIIAYRALSWPHDIAIGMILLMIAVLLAQQEGFQDGQFDGAPIDGSRLFVVAKEKIAPSASRRNERPDVR